MTYHYSKAVRSEQYYAYRFSKLWNEDVTALRIRGVTVYNNKGYGGRDAMIFLFKNYDKITIQWIRDFDIVNHLSNSREEIEILKSDPTKCILYNKSKNIFTKLIANLLIDGCI